MHPHPGKLSGSFFYLPEYAWTFLLAIFLYALAVSDTGRTV